MIVVHTSTSNNAVPEVHDDLLQRALVHLAVGDGDARLGNQLAKAGGGVLDGTHPVVDPEDLALAQQLAPDRLDGDPLVVAADVREDRLAVGRRRVQQCQVADADEAHLERARDRRGGQRQHVDVRLELLHQLLVLHAEALLLVDDQQAEVLEVHVSTEQAVGSDHAVDVAGLDAGDDVAGLGRRQEPAQRLDADGVAGEAIGERVAVLGGQQRRRDQHGDLLAVLDRLEGGPHCDLGLAEADVAAEQTVHRIGPFHVGLDVGGGDTLVRRVDVREGVLHLGLPRRVLAEREPLGVHPLLVKDDELLRDLTHRRADAALGLGEVAPPRRCNVGDSPPTYWRRTSIWSDGTYSRSSPL